MQFFVALLASCGVCNLNLTSGLYVFICVLSWWASFSITFCFLESNCSGTYDSSTLLSYPVKISFFCFDKVGWLVSCRETIFLKGVEVRNLFTGLYKVRWLKPQGETSKYHHFYCWRTSEMWSLPFWISESRQPNHTRRTKPSCWSEEQSIHRGFRACNKNNRSSIQCLRHPSSGRPFLNDCSQGVLNRSDYSQYSSCTLAMETKPKLHSSAWDFVPSFQSFR